MPALDPSPAAPTVEVRRRTRNRAKVAPDSNVRLKLLAIASEIVKECGVSRLTVADVLSQAELGTRAFYRHFDSKDQLVQAVFVEMGRVEMHRLRDKMISASGPLEAVAAWIEGRLDLAFDDGIRSDLRGLSLEARSQMFGAPELVDPAYRELMKPLIDQLVLGKQQGVFPDIDPLRMSELLQGAVWACLETVWKSGDPDWKRARDGALRFCLGGLGAPHVDIEAIVNPQ